jgi:hypothetical protein
MNGTTNPELHSLIDQLGRGPDSPLANAIKALTMAFADNSSDDDARVRKLAKTLLRMRRQLGALQRAVYAFEQAHELFVRAVGACTCWGELPDCTRCGGWGRAGWLEPEPAAFRDVLLPLVQRRGSWLEPFLSAGQDAQSVAQAQDKGGQSNGQV